MKHSLCFRGFRQLQEGDRRGSTLSLKDSPHSFSQMRKSKCSYEEELTENFFLSVGTGRRPYHSHRPWIVMINDHVRWAPSTFERMRLSSCVCWVCLLIFQGQAWTALTFWALPRLPSRGDSYSICGSSIWVQTTCVACSYLDGLGNQL